MQPSNSLIVRMFNGIFMCLKFSFLWKYFYFYKGGNSILWQSNSELSEAALIFKLKKKGGGNFPVWFGFFFQISYGILPEDMRHCALGTCANVLHFRSTTQVRFLDTVRWVFRIFWLFIIPTLGLIWQGFLTYCGTENSSSHWNNSFTLLRGFLKSSC